MEAAPKGPPDTDEACDTECVICLEAIEESTPLPCSCKVPYCLRCWDKSLARSFNACGQARCPTCRGPVRVDYDADCGRLVFSREAEDLTIDRELSELHVGRDVDEGDMAARVAEADAKAARISSLRQAAVNRLVAQALPAQARILQKYGERHLAIRRIAEAPEEELRELSISELKHHICALGGKLEGCIEKADLLSRLSEAAGGAGALSSYCASARCGDPPACVCGSSLMRLSGMARLRRMVEQMQPDLPPEAFENLVSQLTMASGMHGAGVVCDLCEAHLPISTAVWTCENGSSTILHATSYDVCDGCFVRHTCGMASTMAPSAPAQDEAGPSGVQ